jgi:GDP-D-mannose 3',5'-epimerase
VDECVEGTTRLTRSNFSGPVNIGSEEMVTINGLVDIVCDIAGKKLEKIHIPGLPGVRGRNSDNRLIAQKLGWRPSQTLRRGLELTYTWVETQVMSNR